MRRGLYSHTAIVGSGQLVAQVISALMFLFLARHLEVAEFGRLAATYGAALVASIIVEFGASLLWTRRLTSGDVLLEYAASFRSRLACCLPVLALAALLVLAAPWGATVFWGLTLATLVAMGRIATCPARAQNKLVRLSVVVIGEKVILFGFVLVAAAWSTMGPATFLMWASMAALLSVTANLLMITGVSLVSFLPWRRPWVNPFRETMHLGIGAVAVGIQSLDAMVLQVAAGPLVAGIYAAVGRWTQPMGLLESAVIQGNYADMAREPDNRGAIVLLRRCLVFLSISMVPIIAVAIFAEALVAVLLGPAYIASAGVLRLLALSTLVTVLNSPIAAFLQARGSEKITSRAFMVFIPGQLVCMGVMAHFLGPSAAAGAVLVAQIGLNIVLSIAARRLLTRSPAPVS